MIDKKPNLFAENNTAQDKPAYSGVTKYARLPDVSPEVLVKLSQGDDAAFDTIYLHYKESLTDFLYFLMHDRDDAENIAQDIFVALWEHREEITSVKHFKNYLFQSARYRVYDQLKKNGVVDRYTEFTRNSYAMEFENDPEEIYRGHEMALFIELSLQGMPEMQSCVFRMIHEEGLSLSEAADRLHITYKAADGLYYRAKQALRKLIIYSFFLFFYL